MRKERARPARIFSRASPPALREPGGVLLLPPDQVIVGASRRPARLLVGRAALQREKEGLRLRAAEAGDGVQDGTDVLGMAVARHLDEGRHRTPVAYRDQGAGGPASHFRSRVL